MTAPTPLIEALQELTGPNSRDLGDVAHDYGFSCLDLAVKLDEYEQAMLQVAALFKAAAQ